MPEIVFNQPLSSGQDETLRQKDESMREIRRLFESGDMEGGMAAMRQHIERRAQELREIDAENLSRRRAGR